MSECTAHQSEDSKISHLIQCPDKDSFTKQCVSTEGTASVYRHEM